jgi:hypothetical protein
VREGSILSAVFIPTYLPTYHHTRTVSSGCDRRSGVPTLHGCHMYISQAGAFAEPDGRRSGLPRSKAIRGKNELEEGNDHREGDSLGWVFKGPELS